MQQRLADSLETAAKQSGGLVIADYSVGSFVLPDGKTSHGAWNGCPALACGPQRIKERRSVP